MARSNADRQKDYRRRRKSKVRVLQLRIPNLFSLSNWLMRAGFLAPENEFNRQAIEIAAVDLLTALRKNPVTRNAPSDEIVLIVRPGQPERPTYAVPDQIRARQR